MAKVHKDAAKFQADVSSNFQQALRKFEGMITAENKNQNPKSAPKEGTTPANNRPLETPPTPANSAPNIIDLVITIPEEEDRPTTSKLRTAVKIIPQHTSRKGKELATPLAHIETVSTSESVESEDSIMER
jgi:hypothetical protein